jgi:2-keto-4-pentenoate hydratase/2-oxohepta-3-ene-1,7-dioic acid hydratase in catechol pathway
MRLGSYYAEGGQARACGLVGGDMLVDLNRADSAVPADLLAIIAQLDELRPRLTRLLGDPPADASFALSAAELAPPLRPGKIIGVGLNYRDHAAETGQALPDYPTVFAKFPSSVTGPAQPIRLPAAASNQVDYEGELGVVIGRCAHSVPEADALAAVAGYVVVNDVSARDVQNRTSQWTLGKSFDTFAPFGPFLVTADEVPDPQRLDLSVTVSGSVMQHSSTANMVFSVAALVSLLSEIVTLEPGDLIATGTPGGVGAARTPPRFLRDGDVVEVAIESLGQLRNPVVGVVASGSVASGSVASGSVASSAPAVS